MEESKKIENKKRREKSQGITLIALVITIIVLLILAGVSIAMLTGENGILTQATNAKERTDKATEEEKIQMAVLGSSIVDNGYAEVLDTDSFTREIQNQFGSQQINVHPNGDGSFIITVEDTQRKYYVNDDKTVINSDNIVEISDEQGLINVRDDVKAGNTYEGKAVLLTSDITLSDNWTPIGIMSPDTDNKNPETGDNKPFKGIFDGGNHIINNLKISSTENKYNGLFSFVVDGTIRNVTIGENSEVTGNKGAGIVGYLYGFQGNISNCTNYANTNGAGIVRMIAGQHTIYNCKNYGTINDGFGGIVGSSNGIADWPEEFKNYSHKIINCGNYGNIVKNITSVYCGGITAYLKGEILNCCNKGNIVSKAEYNTGGIAGSVDGRIENCYNIGDINGINYVGGIIGAGADSPGTGIYNCYTTGNVSGNFGVGEINGWTDGINVIKEQINCYTKDDTFLASDLGDAFKDNPDPEKANQPLLYWEVKENESESY